ncbi:MAG: zinc-dependent metalloprotease [Elusimicrobiota bacterium]
MNNSYALALAVFLALPAAAAETGAAPELTDVGVPSAQSARELAAKEAAERPLIAVMEKDGHFLISLQSTQLDKPYLLSATVSRGLGTGIHSGDQEGNFLIAFRRTGDILQLFRLNTGFRADPGTPIAEAVKSAFPDVPIAAVKIATENPAAGFLVVPAEGLFLPDLTDVQATVARSFDIPSGALKPAGGVTRIDKASGYHSNLEVDATFVFAPQVPVQSAALPDTRLIPVGVHYSITAMPEKDCFDERAADPRVGYFTTNFRDYSATGLKDRFDPMRRLAEHWRLEKAVPDAPVSDVKKPIVWWLDEGMPKEYRGAVKAGILAWNEAFEAVGLRNAIVVKEVDKDMTPKERANFNPADASYNMVRWFIDPSAGSSYGPPRANPLTGEIYSATVSLSDNFARLWEMMRKPELASTIDEDVRPDPAQLAALQAHGITEAQKEQVVQEYLTNVMVHEIGHTLGLRHNFEGSKLLPLNQMGKDGLMSSSIMDYVPISLPVPGMPQIYFQTKPGPYDKWAIEYAYKPVSPDPATKTKALQDIARRANTDPTLAYATDEDVKGINPDAQRFDFSNEPVKYAETLVQRANNLWGRSATALTPEQVPPPYAALNEGLGLYRSSVNNILPVIGGVRSDRRPTDEGGPRLKPVPAAEQREALNFLTRNVFAAGAFAVPPELALRSAPDPLETSAGRGLPDVPRAALGIQTEALGHIYDPATLRRLELDAQIEPKTALKLSEVFTTVHRSVWGELAGKGRVDVSPMRRQLQRAYVDELSTLAQDESAPGDAVGLARADLAAIARDAKRAQTRTTDPLVKAHLAEIVRLAGKLDEGEPGVAKR